MFNLLWHSVIMYMVFIQIEKDTFSSDLFTLAHIYIDVNIVLL